MAILDEVVVLGKAKFQGGIKQDDSGVLKINDNNASAYLLLDGKASSSSSTYTLTTLQIPAGINGVLFDLSTTNRPYLYRIIGSSEEAMYNGKRLILMGGAINFGGGVDPNGFRYDTAGSTFHLPPFQNSYYYYHTDSNNNMESTYCKTFEEFILFNKRWFTKGY